MCGIFGIYNNPKATELTTLGLFAEQHRGQESCGIAVNDGITLRMHKKMGLVKEVFTPDVLKDFRGNIAIGHVRYPTRGLSTIYNSQPHIVETLSGPSYALTSNGDLVNYNSTRKVLESKGVYFASNNDGELILKYIVYQVEKKGKSIIDSIRKFMKYVNGADSSILATKSELYIFRDPYAFRPICYGELRDGSYVVASETCALDILYPKWYKELKAGQIARINADGIEVIDHISDQYDRKINEKHCIFEHIYFSRPDSIIYGENVHLVRQKLGRLLAEKDANLPVDVVVPVPDSSNFIALGYSKERKLPFEFGLIRNHYVGRTFIEPEQTIRDESVFQKFNVLPGFFQKKKIILIDDSIVRGTTIRKIIKMIRNAGVAEIHVRIGSPPVKFSCYYGIDTPTREELTANTKKIEEIRQFIGADSLTYLDISQLSRAVKSPDKYCYACFDGKYPVL